MSDDLVRTAAIDDAAEEVRKIIRNILLYKTDINLNDVRTIEVLEAAVNAIVALKEPKTSNKQTEAFSIVDEAKTQIEIDREETLKTWFPDDRHHDESF